MLDDGKTGDPAADAPTIDTGGQAPPAAPDAAVREIGGFRILGKLGEGGMGIVYEAEQQNPRRRVALKVIRGGQFVDELHQHMFRRETETLARLAHPNIAAIYEAGRTEDGRHFFTMELVSGRTLGAYCRERLGGERPNTEQARERLRLFATICRAVNYAHQRGVIHRDLKPSNIVVTDAGDVKVLDFGLARITDADVNAATVASELGTIKGTLPYMSPEQARGDSRDVDVRSDVYSLGVILYELLAGRQPYETAGASIVQAIRTICEEPPSVLRSTAGGLPIGADLQTLTAKALAKEPEGRYQSAGALAEDVDRYLADQPILAHPPSTMYQIRKLVSRHKGRVAALGAIGVLLVVLMVTMVVQARRVRMERDRATAEAAKSEAINRFLLDALGGADPWNRGSRTVTLVDALHQAQGKAHEAFAGQPLIEASVLQTLGTTFGGLSEFADADSALRVSLALREVAAGRTSEERAQSLDALADMNLRWQRYSEAEKYARAARDIQVGLHGANSLEALPATANLATALSKEAKYAEAREMANQVLQVARAARGPGTHAGAAAGDAGLAEWDVLSVLGEVALGEGDGKAQLAFARERLALCRLMGAGHGADVAQCLNDLATAQMVNGDLAGAESTFVAGIAIGRQALGDDHPTVAILRENLGNVYFRQGKLDQTARNLELVLAMRRKALGDDSEPVARTLANMATVYRKSGQLELAERTYREAIPRLAGKLGPGNPDVGLSLLGLGDDLRREGKFAEAESTLRRALDILVKANGENHAMTQRAIQTLVDLYKDWKKPAEAAAYATRLQSAK